jgi:5-methylcytosine-specific restriction endonuclease McrA
MALQQSFNWTPENYKPVMTKETPQNPQPPSTIEKFFEFPVKQVRTRYSVKYDLSDDYVEEVVERVKAMYDQFYENYEQKSVKQKMEYLKKLADYRQKLGRPVYYIQPLCKEHRMQLGIKFDGNLKRKNIVVCPNCFMQEKHPAPYEELTNQYFCAGLNNHLEAELHEMSVKAHRFLEEQRNSVWRDNYNDYMQSPEWKEKRKVVLKRDQYLCQGCLQEKATQVHHLSYDHLGKEPLFELISICDSCHEQCHSQQQHD